MGLREIVPVARPGIRQKALCLSGFKKFL